MTTTEAERLEVALGVAERWKGQAEIAEAALFKANVRIDDLDRQLLEAQREIAHWHEARERAMAAGEILKAELEAAKEGTVALAHRSATAYQGLADENARLIAELVRLSEVVGPEDAASIHRALAGKRIIKALEDLGKEDG